MSRSQLDRKIDEIISNQITKYALKDLNKLYLKKNKHKYVLFRIAKLEFERRLYDLSKEHFNILQNEPEYYVVSTYYLACIADREKEYNLVLEYLKKIMDIDSEYKELITGLYSEVLYKLKRSNDVIEFYRNLSEKGSVDAKTYYYASKAYAIRKDQPDNIFKCIKCIRSAIELDDKNVEYHDFLRKIYINNNMYSGAISETKILISLDTPFKTQYRLSLPELEVKVNRKSEALLNIKRNMDDGVTSFEQDSLYFDLLTRSNDYKEAESISENVIGENNSGLANYLKLIRMYNREYMCDRAIEICDDLENKKLANVDILGAEAEALIQLGKYEEAKKVLHKIIRYSLSNKFYRLLALCCYLEGDFKTARSIMDTISVNSKSEMDTFLRSKLYKDNQSRYMHDSLFNSLLSGYNLDLVHDKNGYRLSMPSHMGVLKPEVHRKDFLLKMNDKILYLEPSYVLDRDTYLINYEEEVGLINNKPTKYFIVDAMCGDGVFSIKPVIPTSDAESNFKIVR